MSYYCDLNIVFVSLSNRCSPVAVLPVRWSCPRHLFLRFLCSVCIISELHVPVFAINVTVMFTHATFKIVYMCYYYISLHNNCEIYVQSASTS